jgi:hypothetical protein
MVAEAVPFVAPVADAVIGKRIRDGGGRVDGGLVGVDAVAGDRVATQAVIVHGLTAEPADRRRVDGDREVRDRSRCGGAWVTAAVMTGIPVTKFCAGVAAAAIVRPAAGNAAGV